MSSGISYHRIRPPPHRTKASYQARLRSAVSERRKQTMSLHNIRWKIKEQKEGTTASAINADHLTAENTTIATGNFFYL